MIQLNELSLKRPDVLSLMSDDLFGIGKAASALSQPLQDFLNRLLGPAAEETGELFADQIRYIRWKNSLHIVEQARKLLEARKITPQNIPLKTLMPILEGASLENNDENLKEKWITLIANAATGEKISIRYPEILKQLDSLDAVLLDELFEIDQKPVEDKQEIVGKLCNPEDYKSDYAAHGISSQNLVDYIESAKKIKLDPDDVSESLFCLAKLNLLDSSLIHYPQIDIPFTVLGKAFMAAVKIST